MECRHEDAVYNLEFKRYSDENGIPRKFVADLTIYCRHCGTQFTFKDPVVTDDRLILSSTIEPEERLSDSLDLRDLFLSGPNSEQA